MNVFVFDIETVPDVAAGRRLFPLEGLDDEAVAKAMIQQRQQAAGTDFLKLHLHRVVAISAVLSTSDRLKVWSLGTAESSERELLERFFEGLDRYAPRLVSWNGGGFDLPVLHYRSLLHNVSAPRYWETGGDDTHFRWDNYLNRFHERHTDLMDVLSGYQARAAVRLDDLARLLGFPGKLGMDGSEVWGRYLAGDIDAIRAYCETDVLNLYLIYLRYELMRGRSSPDDIAAKYSRLEESLAREGKPHLDEFLRSWRGAEP